MKSIGQEFATRFAQEKVDKILTIEASGIGVAAITSLFFNEIPVVFAKKQEANNMSNDVYSTTVFSYTKNKSSVIRVDKRYLREGERILIIDDFLANGNAALGLCALASQAGAHVVGVGAVVEKGFQEGRSRLEKAGYCVESLAVIKSLENCTIVLDT